MLEPVAQDNTTERPVCVVNTHLFYHPRAPHIRLLQIGVLLREAELFINEYVSVSSFKPARSSGTLLFIYSMTSSQLYSCVSRCILQPSCPLRINVDKRTVIVTTLPAIL